MTCWKKKKEKMGIRTTKTGMDLEIHAMQDLARTMRKLPLDMRQRVANWVAAQPWESETKQVPPVDPRQLPLPATGQPASTEAK